MTSPVTNASSGCDADDASKENFLSLNLTFSEGRYPSRKTLTPTRVESTLDTMPYAAGSP